MAYSVSSLTQRIRYELGDRPWEDSSCSAASASSTITGATTGFWVKGDIGEFQEDGDTFLTISEAAGTITATRSYWGSTGAAHASKRVFKNPRYGLVEIQNAITAVINDRLWPRAYKAVADTVTPAPATTVWYDLAADARGLINVVQQYGTSDQKLGFYGTRHTSFRVVFERNVPTALVASGVGLRFPDGFFHASNTVRINYQAKITDTQSGGSYSDLTLGDAATEAVIYGACAHLEAALENRKPRKPRQDRETLRGAALFQRKFQEALNQAEVEMRDTIPRMPAFSHG